MITKLRLYEVRFQDIYLCNNLTLNCYKNAPFDTKNEDFIKSILIKSVNKRFSILYNHSTIHDLKNRIKERTNLKTINEFNYLLRKALIELFLYEYEKDITSYSLYFKEYNFSIIVNIKYNDNEIKMGTLLKGNDVCVGKKVNIESVL